MKRISAILICLLLIIAAVSSMTAYATDAEPGKYGDGTFDFYWPKDLPLPNGKVVLKRYIDEMSTRIHETISDSEVTLTNGQAVSRYRLQIDFTSDYDNVTDFDEYQKKVLKVFKNKIKSER